MVEYQQQKGDPRGAQRPDSRAPNMTWARQLFSTKLAWDERVTQLHAVNTIKEVFGRPSCSLTGLIPRISQSFQTSWFLEEVIFYLNYFQHKVIKA